MRETHSDTQRKTTDDRFFTPRRATTANAKNDVINNQEKESNQVKTLTEWSPAEEAMKHSGDKLRCNDCGVHNEYVKDCRRWTDGPSDKMHKLFSAPGKYWSVSLTHEHLGEYQREERWHKNLVVTKEKVFKWNLEDAKDRGGGFSFLRSNLGCSQFELVRQF